MKQQIVLGLLMFGAIIGAVLITDLDTALAVGTWIANLFAASAS